MTFQDSSYCNNISTILIFTGVFGVFVYDRCVFFGVMASGCRQLVMDQLNELVSSRPSQKNGSSHLSLFARSVNVLTYHYMLWIGQAWPVVVGNNFSDVIALSAISTSVYIQFAIDSG